MFSDDGAHLAGAFGERLLKARGHVDQLDAVRRRLTEDRGTRRAVAVVLSPTDLVSRSRDHPCLLGLQFLIRNNRLEMISYMRSQSALMVLPYDVFLFTAIQSWIADSLEIEVGPYTHIAGSFHIYSDELELAAEVDVPQANQSRRFRLQGRNRSLTLSRSNTAYAMQCIVKMSDPSSHSFERHARRRPSLRSVRWFSRRTLHDD
jgi:thymidylate synthase